MDPVRLFKAYEALQIVEDQLRELRLCKRPITDAERARKNAAEQAFDDARLRAGLTGRRAAA